MVRVERRRETRSAFALLKIERAPKRGSFHVRTETFAKQAKIAIMTILPIHIGIHADENYERR